MSMPSPSQLKSYAEFFKENGYLIARSVFSKTECDALIEHYMELRRQPRPEDYAGHKPDSNDPLLKYPRMIQMHKWDARSKAYMIDSRINAVLTAILGREPVACQTMLYFKPPGARGQALHQDNFYLRVSPGTCAAAWMALERSDEDNGCMMVVPGSHTWETLCTTGANVKDSFTDRTVPVPPGTKTVPCIMDAGDILFFNGQTVHGSTPNKTADRFRRSLIAHYAEGISTKVTSYCNPIYRMDGTEIQLEDSPGGGKCGMWVDRDGAPVVEMTGTQPKTVMVE